MFSVAVLIIIKVGLEVYPKKCNRQFNSEEGHNGMEDWKITIINRAENVLELRRRESYMLDTFFPNELNERFVGIPML